jgi:hypothetical protein
MANAAIAFDNLADLTTSTLTAAAITLAPVANLLNPHVGKKWRINAAVAAIIVDLGSSQPIDTIMLAGLSGTTPTLRVRLSSADATGVAGDIANSGLISSLPYFDSRHRLFVYLLSAPLSARYVRIDISESAVLYIEAGRIFIGVREGFETNFQTPWLRSQVRTTIDTFGIGGQTFTDLRQGYFQQKASFNFITEDERIDFIEEIATRQANRGHLDMLWIKDTASDNLSRDCIWGYVDGDFSTTQQLYIIPPLYTVDFSIRARL